MSDNTKRDYTKDKVWMCRVGVPKGTRFLQVHADGPMRDAVLDALAKLIGVEELPSQDIFSGWGNEWTEQEIAVLEDREPNAVLLWLDDRPAGELERLFTAMREEIKALTEDRDQVENHILDLFNPPDDDTSSGYSCIQAAHDFIDALDCTCKYTGPDDKRESAMNEAGTHPAYPWDNEDVCGRCRTLGRYFNVPVCR